MAEAENALDRWENTFWTSVRASVVGGVILAAILGVAGLIISEVTKLSTGEALLKIGLPALAAILLAAGFIIGRAALRTVRSWQEWQAGVSAYVLDLVRQVRRLRLQEVIHTAQIWDWKVWEDDDNDLVFESPDGEVTYVRDMDVMPHAVAEHLHDTAPDHFPEKWVDFIANVGHEAIEAKHAAGAAQDELADIGRQLAALEDRLDDAVRANGELARQLMAVRLGDVIHEARRAGWVIRWGNHEVVFENTAGELATVSYQRPEELDLERLRQVMGLRD